MSPKNLKLHSVEENLNLSSMVYDYLMIGFPKYYEYPILTIFHDLKKILPVRDTDIPTLAFCTQAGPLPTDFSKLEKLLKAKNHILTVTKSFPIANNMTIFRMFPTTEQQKASGNWKQLNSQIDPLLNTFLARKEDKETIKKWEGPLFHAVAVFFTKLMPVFGMKYSASEECISCSLCAQKCPQNNIRMESGRPRYGRNCIFCMRCINICPKSAILYHNAKCPQYQCRDNSTDSEIGQAK